MDLQDLGLGAIAVTGETGAGKSSLVQVLAAALGGKVPGTALRPGCDRGEVQAWFDLTDCAGMRAWLEAQDLPPSLDNYCVLRRTFAADGRSRAQINGSACALSSLTEAGTLLVDLVAQNQHHSLLKDKNQGQLLDDSWDSGAALKSLAALHRQLAQVRLHIEELRSGLEYNERRREFLQQQLEDFSLIEEAALQVEDGEEFADLEGEYRRLANAGDSLQALDAVEAVLRREPGSADEQLGRALKLLPDSDGDERDPAAPIAQMLRDASELVKEAVLSVNRLAESLDGGADRLATLDRVLGRCHELARRHQCTPQDLWRQKDSWQQELQQLQTQEPQLHALEQQNDELAEQWQTASSRVSEHRRRAAQALMQAVNERLALLGMAQARFEVAVSEAEATPRGNDRVAFLYSPAKGVAPDSIARVASGGELSRLYLSLCLSNKSLARAFAPAADSLPPVLVLDEADIGIGGKTAHKLAGLVRQLGEHRQVLCVTHLPQVAAAAQHHLKVSKSEEDVPRLQVQLLDDKERLEELARMLGGGRAGQESRELADKLLKAGITAA